MAQDLRHKTGTDYRQSKLSKGARMHVGYRELPSNRKFGVELEVSNSCTKKRIGGFLKEFEEKEGTDRLVKVTPGKGSGGWAETRRNDYWHVKYDSTCGPAGKYLDYGWEVASYIGRGCRDIKRISKAAGYLKECGVETNRNCGLHIHVEAGDLTKSQVGLLIARWLKVEPYLVQICDPSRNKNFYCKTLSSRLYDKNLTYNPYDMLSLWELMSPQNLQTHNNDEKKYALNFVGYAISKTLYIDYRHYDRPTIELRLPECRLDSEHVANWTRLFLNFVDSCMIYPTPGPSQICTETEDIHEIMSYLGLQEKRGFWILDKELLDTKKWLLNKIVESSRTSLIITRQTEDLLDFISHLY